jgi:hypothetical protein
MFSIATRQGLLIAATIELRFVIDSLLDPSFGVHGSGACEPGRGVFLGFGCLF